MMPPLITGEHRRTRAMEHPVQRHRPPAARRYRRSIVTNVIA
jgi:hypothetical protein